MTSIELESMDVKSSGEVLWVKIDGHGQTDPVFVMRTGLFFRNQGKIVPRTKTPRIPIQRPDQEIILSEKIVVDSDQAIRYSQASGDTNPIHLDSDFALTVGLPDVILQVLCTMSFATQAILTETKTGSTKLIRVRTRFTSPVFMGDILTTRGWVVRDTPQSRVIGFETYDQENIPVLTLGEVELLTD